ncbi:transmembrane protein 14A isoform X2 [Myotis myotis]|nr:transmembrane protein 14A isoform X2 [Myotis myotis]
MRASGRHRPEPAAAVEIRQSGAQATRTTSGLQVRSLLRLAPGRTWGCRSHRSWSPPSFPHHTPTAVPVSPVSGTSIKAPLPLRLLMVQARDPDTEDFSVLPPFQGHRLLLCPGFPPQRPFRTKLCFLSCSTTAALPMDLVGFGYAAFVTFGSIVGYKRRGSIPSLIAGLFVGLLAGYGAYRVSNDKRDVKVSLFAAFFLATIMGVRFKRSKKIIPAGLVAGLSLMMILRLVLLLL